MRDGLVKFDVNSLISGEELEKGFTYSNSHREFENDQQRIDAANGLLSTDEILKIAPRVLNTGYARTDERTK